MSLLIVGMDVTIMNVALPAIQKDLHGLPYFRRIAMRRLDYAADAEDAVQDAFLALRTEGPASLVSGSWTDRTVTA